MAGGTGSGIIITGHCFCCCFNSFEEIDVPKVNLSQITKKSVKVIIDETKECLLQRHESRNCKKKKLVFGLEFGESFRLDRNMMRKTKDWAVKIINSKK